MSGAADGPLCPSSPAAPGRLLIGLVQADGHVAHMRTPLPVDQDFLDRAAAHGPLGTRFRFSGPCAQGGCGHWTGKACGLIGELQDHVGKSDVKLASDVPACGIRASCRWWLQEGRDACAVCTLVASGRESAAAEAAT